MKSQSTKVIRIHPESDVNVCQIHPIVVGIHPMLITVVLTI